MYLTLNIKGDAFMYREFISFRITELRMKKSISEYQMSFDLGKSHTYIQSITARKSMPSLTSLFQICEYFEITISDFFSPMENCNNQFYFKQ